MKQRGRKSGESQAVVRLALVVPRLEPPGALTKDQRLIWLETVNARPADWFGLHQVPLLESYCRHAAYGRMLAAEINRAEPGWLRDDDGLKRHKTLLAMHELETRAASSLGTRLRLTNASVQRAENARVVDQAFSSVKPWELLDAEAEQPEVIEG